MNANIGFALSAAVLSLAIVIGAGLKGDWAVVAVYAVLVAGFLARAAFGRSARRRAQGGGGDAAPGDVTEPGTRHRPERELRKARFRRR